MDHDDDEHCTICLQSFLDRTIIPVCAHEFCLECILLWSVQSRKCPLCSRSFADAYLIHRIRSQFDYQKHYLPPLPSSPPPLSGESRANALRHARRERQWGRRQRQQREEQDQLERAITRRRSLYQRHLYAKHVASNPYTRYRPFPSPAQFAASQDLISRMTTFLRRELRVWPNLDVEFLTTYTISLMKSIDIRSESAVKLLSEFLDLDTPYTPGTRHLNAEHFAHEIYSYLRSPYRDLNTYDQIAQYDTPREISSPRNIDTRSRWSAGPSPPRRSRSQSISRRLSPVPHRENNRRNVRNSSAEVHREAGSSRRHSRGRSPRSATPSREHRIDSSNRSLSPPGGVRDILLRDDHSHPWGLSYPDTSSSAARTHFGDDKKGNDQPMENTEEFLPATAAQKLNVPRDGSSATAPTVGKARVPRPVERTRDEPVNYVDKACGDSAANSQRSRERSTGVHHRTLSESVQAYLFRPAIRRPTRNPASEPADGSTSETRPSLVLRLTDGPLDSDVGNVLSFRKTPVERTSNGGDATSEQTRLDCRSPRVFFPSADDDASCAADRGPVQSAFPPVATVTLTHAALSDGHTKSVPTHPSGAQDDVVAVGVVDRSDGLDLRCDSVGVVVSLTDRVQACSDVSVARFRARR